MVKNNTRTRMPAPQMVAAARPPLRQASTPWFKRLAVRYGLAAWVCAATALGVLLWADAQQGRGQLGDTGATAYGWLIAVLFAGGIALTVASRIASSTDQRRGMGAPRASGVRANAGARRNPYKGRS